MARKLIRGIDATTMISLESKAKAAGISTEELIRDILDVCGKYVRPDDDSIFPFITMMIGQIDDELDRLKAQFAGWPQKDNAQIREIVDPLTVVDCLLHIKQDLLHMGLTLNRMVEAATDEGT